MVFIGVGQSTSPVLEACRPYNNYSGRLLDIKWRGGWYTPKISRISRITISKINISAIHKSYKKWTYNYMLLYSI